MTPHPNREQRVNTNAERPSIDAFHAAAIADLAHFQQRLA